MPPADVQALRDLTRTRKNSSASGAAMSSASTSCCRGPTSSSGRSLSDIMGQGGRAVLDALASGKSDPERLADQVRTKVRASRAALVEALRGRLGAHQRVVLRLHLAQADAIEAAVAELDREVGDRLAPFCDDVARLSTMPGLSSVSANAILSEIGSDMSHFPTPAHLVSWAGLCPRNDESAGRRRSTRLRHGAPWLKTLLVQAAWSAVRVKAAITAPCSIACGRGAGVLRELSLFAVVAPAHMPAPDDTRLTPAESHSSGATGGLAQLDRARPRCSSELARRSDRPLVANAGLTPTLFI